LATGSNAGLQRKIDISNKTSEEYKMPINLKKVLRISEQQQRWMIVNKTSSLNKRTNRKLLAKL